MNPADQPPGRPPEPSRTPAPSRSRLVAIFGGLAGVGLAIGIGAAEIAGAGSVPPKKDLLGSVAAPSPTPPQTSSEPSPGSSPGSSATPDYRPISADPLTEKGLDFGTLTTVVEQGGQVTLRFDRVTIYTGEDAKKHNNGVAPEKGYLVENSNTAKRSFTLDPQASIVAVDRLRTEPGAGSREELTVDQFVENFAAGLTTSTEDLQVWLRHTDGLKGDVTAVAEASLP